LISESQPIHTDRWRWFIPASSARFSEKFHQTNRLNQNGVSNTGLPVANCKQSLRALGLDRSSVNGRRSTMKAERWNEETKASYLQMEKTSFACLFIFGIVRRLIVLI
jgi:hypothetical protein